MTKRLNYMTQSQIDKAFEDDKLSDNQIYYLNNQDEMKDYSKNYYAENKEKQSVIDSRRRAELTRRGTQHYKDYMENYRQDQIDSFDSLTTEEQETITEMKREDNLRYAENRKIKRKKEKQERQLQRLLDLEEKYKK